MDTLKSLYYIFEIILIGFTFFISGFAVCAVG